METIESFAAAENLSEIPERENPNLGESNPLIHFLDLSRRESVAALVKIVLEKIRKYGGEVPTRLESTLVCSYRYPASTPQLRFIARFEVRDLSAQQMDLLETLVAYIYPVKVRTRTSSDGKSKIDTDSYYPINTAEMQGSKTAGWYMGPDQSLTDSLHCGLSVHKDLGVITGDNFFEDNDPIKYIIEVREASGLYTTDIGLLVAEVALILGQGKLFDPGNLLTEIYNGLIRLGIRRVNDLSAYGTDEIINQINEPLIFPAANPELARAIGQQNQSVLLVGVYGTGKSLSVQQLLHRETGLLIVPIDPLEITKEMFLDPDKQKILPRLADVAHRTGLTPLLHIDDIEYMAGNENTYSHLLNLMAGVRNSGFLVIGSTNVPEKISPALIQPGRFGVLVYCPLQNERARFEILKIYAITASAELQLPLFNSDEERDRILRAIAAKTEYFTPRYLAEIINKAKSLLMARIVKAKGKDVGLTEADLTGFRFTLEDFRQAFRRVSAAYDAKATKVRDDQIREFVFKNTAHPLGFQPNGQHPEADIF